MEAYHDPTASAKSYLEFVIPQIGLRALKHVRYRNLVQLILKANPDMEITHSDMQLLWDAVIHKCYHFVCACEREAAAMEVCTCRLQRPN